MRHESEQHQGLAMEKLDAHNQAERAKASLTWSHHKNCPSDRIDENGYTQKSAPIAVSGDSPA
jgi:hypothetical protein